ncbi:MAG: xanthine phosphoribosyltransferase [Clostridia bacterium]|nr:xanthine phosphoribosyltransferase [Clostridia bacterium]
MKLLEERILKDGKVLPGEILKVGSFLNHLIDSRLLDEIGKEISKLFAGYEINKVLTLEASGIPMACAAAHYIDCPVLFAKKSKTANISENCYSSLVHSYTHGNDNNIMVEKDFLTKDDKVLVIDDFLANGAALTGLIDLVNQAGAELVGCCAAIEKGYQGGGDKLRAKGIKVESLAIIDKMTDTEVIFRK